MRTLPWRALCAWTVAVAAACAGEGERSVELERVDEQPSTTADEPVVPDGAVADEALATVIPALDGVTYADPDVPPYYDGLRLPQGTRLIRQVIEVGGEPVGYVTVAAAPDDMDYDTFEDAVVDAFFSAPVDVVQGEVAVGGGEAITTTGAEPRWVALAEEFVMEASTPDDPSARREWFWDGLLWIVEGHDGGSFAEQLIGAQHTTSPPDDYDTYVIAGELNERFADLPDYIYLDLPRTDLTTNFADSLGATCAEQWLPFGVAVDPNDSGVDGDNILMQMALVTEWCAGFDDDFRATFMDLPGAHDETVAGIPAIVGDAHVAWMEDGIAFLATSEGPDAIANYRPFLEAFAQAQVDLPPVD